MNGRELFLKACACQPVPRSPVWLMRQAGRVLPEYRALKEKYSFLELVQTPELAAQVTLQPVRRFGFDAAILFSDILVVNEALGQNYRFREAGGIEMDFAVRTAADVDRLQVNAVRERLAYIPQALKLIKAQLGDRTALIGFAGSPWTLANFMMEGGSADAFTHAKALFYSDPKLFSALMEKLTAAVTELLRMQIEAGVDAVQVFDSLGDVLAPEAYAAASARWMKQIVSSLRFPSKSPDDSHAVAQTSKSAVSQVSKPAGCAKPLADLEVGDTAGLETCATKPRVPVIVFGRGAHASWDALTGTGAQVLGVDWQVRLEDVAKQLPGNIAVQGNLDPFLLTTTPGIVAAETRRILSKMKDRAGHIFNLGHGVPPAAKLDCIQALVDTIRAN